MKVLKFGGTSVGSAENIRKVADIIKDYHSKKEWIIVVVSAMSGVTNRLIRLGERAAIGDEEWKTELINLRKAHLDTADKLLGAGHDAVDLIVKEFEDLQAVLTGVTLLSL